MRTDTAVIEAGQQNQEAEYSRTQILNIVKSVIPNQELLDAQARLALAHLEHGGPPDAEPVTVTPLASELPRQRKAARSLLEAIR